MKQRNFPIFSAGCEVLSNTYSVTLVSLSVIVKDITIIMLCNVSGDRKTSRGGKNTNGKYFEWKSFTELFFTSNKNRS